MAWWREQLQQLDDPEASAPAEPRLQGAARELLVRGVSGTALSMLEDAWEPMLEPFPWGVPQAAGLRFRGRLLFSIGAGLLDADEAAVEHPGEFWSLHDAAAHCSEPQSRAMLEEQARRKLDQLPAKVSRGLRPLTVLAAVAANDLVRAGRGRGRAAVVHRLFGTFPL